MYRLRSLGPALLLLLLAGHPVTADEVRDPMRPPAGMAAAETRAQDIEWTLYSTAVSGGQRTAIINGQVVTEGGTVSGARVLAISPSAVRLATAQGEITLRLPVYEIKKGAR